MKNYCLRDTTTGKTFKIFLTKEQLQIYLKENSHIIECINCIECLDAPSITLE